LVLEDEGIEEGRDDFLFIVVAGNITGRFREVVRVGSQDITIRGNVVDGIAKIGTAFIERR